MPRKMILSPNKVLPVHHRIPFESRTMLGKVSLTPERMIEYSIDHYIAFTYFLTPREIKNLKDGTTQNPPPMVATAWPIGVAHTAGIQALLICPNISPQNDSMVSSRFRFVITVFDHLPCFWDGSHSWGEVKQRVIRYMYHIYDAICDQHIARHNHIGGKWSRQDEKFKFNKNFLAATALCQFAYNPHSCRAAKGKLSEMGDLNENKLIHWCFVLPMLEFLVKEMNPFSELEVETILNMDVCRCQEDYLKKAMYQGIFSETKVMERAILPSNDVNAYTARDHDVCKGVPYVFARVGALLIDGFDYAPDDRVNTWTAQERSNLFKAFDPVHVIPLYPPVKERVRLVQYGVIQDGVLVVR